MFAHSSRHFESFSFFKDKKPNDDSIPLSRHFDRNTWSASGLCEVDVMSSEVETSVSDFTLATNRFLRFGRNDGMRVRNKEAKGQTYE